MHPGFPIKGRPFAFPGGEVPSTHERLEITVDGSGDGHSIAQFPEDEVYFSYEKGASNNEAEFNAVILALENLPPRSHARIRTDSQTVVWHLTGDGRTRSPALGKKVVEVRDLICTRELTVEVQWIPRRHNTADRLLKQYVAGVCGAGGKEPMYQKVRRLEAENNRLKARLRKAMRLLKARAVTQDGAPDSFAMGLLEI